MRSRHAPSRVRPHAVLLDVLGFAALVVTLALTSPGVEIARADEAAAMSVDPVLAAAHAAVPKAAAVSSKAGPSCSDPGTPSPASDALVEYQAQRMLREIAARAATEQPPAEPSADQGIVLNGHGYNYRPIKPH